MATIPYVEQRLGGSASVIRFVWGNVTEADTCDAVSLLGRPATIIAAQVVGLMGGCSVLFLGSEDGLNFDVGGLLGPDLVPVELTLSGSRREIFDRPAFLMPVTSGGSGQSVTITVNVYLE